MILSLFLHFISSSQPIDPEYPNQYYLENNGKYLGKINEDISFSFAWNNNYYGKGVRICVIDDGCNHNHKDLAQSFDLNNSWNYVAWENDPSPLSYEHKSGTINAGIIAAQANNIDIIGVASGSKLGCFNLDDLNKSEANIYDALRRGNDYWQVKLVGYPARCENNLCNHEESNPELTQILEGAPATLSFVQPSGSDAFLGGDTNFHAFSRSPRVIIVSDTTNAGTRSAWSNRGTNILVSSVVGGSSSYDDVFFPSFPGLLSGTNETGTEFVDPRNKGAASVAGAVAILLAINPELTWRDVQCMIALSATRVDSRHPSWTRNAADIWYSHIYGFGRLNLETMIHVSDTWSLLPAQVSASGQNTEQEELPAMRNGGIDKYIEIDDSIGTIEYCELSVTLNCSDYSSLRIHLFSPSNTAAYVKAPAAGKEVNGVRTAEFTIRNFLGESAAGKWRLHIVSDGVTRSNVFVNATLRVSGVANKMLFTSYQGDIGSPYKNVKYSETADIVLDTDTIACGVDFNVSINTQDEKNVTFLLGDSFYNSRWPLLEHPVSSKQVTKLHIPCYFKHNSRMNLTVENAEKEFWSSTTVTVNNAANTTTATEMITPSAYSTFTINEDGSVDLPIMPRMDLVYYIDGAYSQHARIQLYDVDTKNVTFETDFSTINNTNLHIDNVTRCPRCVLSFVPNTYSSFSDDCLNIIQPISIIGKDEKAPEPWVLPLNNACPIPNGVFTPTPMPPPTATPLATPSPVPRRTDTPSPSTPGEGLKQNKTAIILGGSFIGVFCVFLLVFLYVNRRKPNEGYLLTSPNDFSYIE